MSVPGSSKYFYFLIFLATILFIPMFICQNIGWLDFWWWMSSNLIILISAGLISNRIFRTSLSRDFKNISFKKIAFGLVSAALLYLIFLAGNFIIRQILDFAGSNIENVYAFKGDASKLRIGLLMLLVIGPGEELFWRAFVQGNFSQRFGRWQGFLLATALYTMIHIPTGNFVLIMAALTGGLFWGWLYMKYNSATTNIISHVVWDIVVFLLLPFQ